MAITQTLTNSFKQELFLGTHNFVADTIKMALFLAPADLNAATTVYASTNETSGTGYISGGSVLLGATVLLVETTAYVDFASLGWTPAAFTARGALIYNASKGNKSIAILDFGGDKTSTTSFIVQMPANTATSALIRIL